MLALQKTKPGAGLEFRVLSEPQAVVAGEVLIRTHSAGICGTDLHIAGWSPGYESMQKAMPVTIGHEFSGVVSMIGSDVPKQLLGRQVTVRPSTTCGHCAECRSGKDDNCVNRTGIGIGRDGAFSGMVAAPWGNCHLLPDDIDMDVAALTEPMTVCAEAVATAEVKAGDKILVLGPGFIGQGVAILARAAGAEVVIVGRGDAQRLGVLKELGFEHAIDTEQTGLDEVLRQHAPFDAIIEATGVPALINASLPYLKKRGIFSIVGIHPRAAEIDVTRLVRMHQQIRGSYRAPIAVWDEVIGFLAANQEMMKRLITHRFRLEDALLGFEVARNKSASKVILQVSTS